jgi:hypothetical protein
MVRPSALAVFKLHSDMTAAPGQPDVLPQRRAYAAVSAEPAVPERRRPDASAAAGRPIIAGDTTVPRRLSDAAATSTGHRRRCVGNVSRTIAQQQATNLTKA